MRILILKSVFCPTEHYLDVTLSSLYKLSIFVNLITDVEFDLLLVGWVHNFRSYIDLSSKLCKFAYNNIYHELWTLNYGKYKILNYMIDFINSSSNEYDCVMFFDHDVYLDILSISKFKSIANLINNDKLGLIAFNQKGDVRHQIAIYENSDTIGDLKIVWPNNDFIGPIATGGFILSKASLLKLDKFNLISVYGLDDHFLCKQLSNKKLLNIVINDIYITHPFDNNEKYILWKKENIIKTANGNIDNYFKNIEESMNLHL